jgi:hypothetical protein
MESIETYQLDSPSGMVSINENVEQPQEEPMAEFSTPISELVQEPDADIVQPMMMGPPVKKESSAPKKRQGSLTPEQMDAVFAGVAAVIAFSKPVQDKITQMIPGGGLVGTLATALIAAIAFYFLKKFLAKKV